MKTIIETEFFLNYFMDDPVRFMRCFKKLIGKCKKIATAWVRTPQKTDREFSNFVF
jgi:hypothetical protein